LANRNVRKLLKPAKASNHLYCYVFFPHPYIPKIKVKNQLGLEDQIKEEIKREF
jgi:hypothetical protein